MIVKYPKHCKKYNSSFEDFAYKKRLFFGGYEIIRICPYCGSEIECEFISEEEVKNEMAIESHEGNQATLRHSVDEEDPVESRCDWCEEEGFDTLYELV